VPGLKHLAPTPEIVGHDGRLPGPIAPFRLDQRGLAGSHVDVSTRLRSLKRAASAICAGETQIHRSSRNAGFHYVEHNGTLLDQ